MSEFLHMGGFGAYIWSAMGVTALLMLLEPISLILKRRSVLSLIRRNKRLEERRSSNNAGIETRDTSHETT